jgi:hypothetical protein
MKAIPVQAGAIFGSWTVIGPSEQRKNRQFLKCRCKCQREYWVRAAALSLGLSVRCRSCAAIERRERRSVDLTNQQFGGWLVVRKLPRDQRPAKYPHRAWLCRCSCGQEKILAYDGIVYNKIGCQSCAAKDNGRTQRGQPYESIFNSAKSQIANRGIPFSLSYADFLRIVNTGRCHYCHTSLTWAKYTNSHHNDRSYKLDRKDNGGGYSPGNVVAACKRCNYAKSDQFSYEEWWSMTACFRDRGTRARPKKTHQLECPCTKELFEESGCLPQ